MDRRSFLSLVATAFGLALTLGWGKAVAGPRARARRRIRRRVRRRIRRRHRRRVAWRIVHGRRVWVVPVGLAIGWELLHEDRVVIVKETRIVEKEGAKVEVAVVQGSDGKTEEVEIAREDTAENRVELEGSTLPEGDKATPGVDAEIEVEEEVEEEVED